MTETDANSRLANAEQTSETREVRLVNALLVSRGWGSRDMDQRAGWKEGTFRSLRAKGFEDELTRARIERVFGQRIFSDERTWLLRQACFRRYGVDVALLKKPELLAWVKKLSLAHRAPSSASSQQLMETLYNHLAVNAKH